MVWGAAGDKGLSRGFRADAGFLEDEHSALQRGAGQLPAQPCFGSVSN